MDCSTSHHYSTPHHTSFEINNSKVYDIENRIQYLKSLEELNSKVINHKNFVKDWWVKILLFIIFYLSREL